MSDKNDIDKPAARAAWGTIISVSIVTFVYFIAAMITKGCVHQ